MTARARLNAIEKQLAGRLGDGTCGCPPDKLHCFFIWPDEPDRLPPEDPGPCPRCGGKMHIARITWAEMIALSEEGGER